MSRLVVRSFTVSLDGYGAGPDQSAEAPMGVGGEMLHGWAWRTRTFRAMFGKEGGAEDTDDRYARMGFENLGAWILGRNMFGPIRGPWTHPAWDGWWGDEPPYHCQVFVLTHYPREPLAMKGGTVFHFVTDGFEAALARATKAAGGKDIRLGGGVATIREALQKRLVDSLHLAFSPVLLGRGEALLAGLDLPALGYAVEKSEPTADATHVMIARKST
jgi:dihydrofolate reductase